MQTPTQNLAIDWQQCLALSNQNPSMAKELLDMFMKDLPSYRHNIQQCFDQQDYKTLYQHVHKLHGATCYCGMPQLQAMLSAFETALKTDQQNTYPKHMAQIIQGFDAVTDCYAKEKFDA